MTPPQASEAAVGLLSRYTAAMIRGDLDTCISIEQRSDTYGYPPEIVAIGLRAIDDGRDPYAAIDAYLTGESFDQAPTP